MKRAAQPGKVGLDNMTLEAAGDANVQRLAAFLQKDLRARRGYSPVLHETGVLSEWG